jgi:hypothetical protein
MDYTLTELGDLRPPPSPGIGHNRGPALDVELAEQNAALEKRRDELLEAVTRAPVEIADNDASGKVADLVRLITACRKAAEASRVERKEPYLAAARVIDNYFRRITEPLDGAKQTLEARLSVYQRRVAFEERRRREEEARRAAEEADRLRQEALARERAAQTDAELDAAIVAGDAAEDAAAEAAAALRAAEVKPAELSRVRGDFGAVASLRRTWTFGDLDRDTLDLETLRPYFVIADLEKAVRAFIRAGGRHCRGVNIYETAETRVR